MTLEEAIVSRTESGTGFQVFPMTIPESRVMTPIPTPCFTYQIVDVVPLHFLIGTDAKLDTSRVQFTAYSNRIKDVEEMLEALRNLWHGFSGTVVGCAIVAVYGGDEPDFEEVREEGGDTVSFEGTFDLFFRYRV